MNDGAERMKEQADAFTNMWADFASKMAGAGFAFRPDAPPPDAARQMRDAMFQAMSKYCEDFMRSPEFLESMKQSLDGAIEFRKQLNDFLTQMHHETQSVSLQDMHGLFQAIEDLQTRVMERMDRIDERLDAMESRVASSPGTKPAARPRKAAKGKPSKRTKK